MLGILLLVATVSAQSPYDHDIRSEFAGDQRTRSAEVQPAEFAVNGGGIVAVRSPILDQEVADQLEGNGWLDVIPGTPGKDYPNYAILPQTSFTCRGRTPGGYYADVETRCQVFHVCDADGRKNSFLCPSGSIFNQKYFICDWWYDFECDDATELYTLNEQVKRGDRASGPKGPGQGHARDELDVGCCAEDEEEDNAHGTYDGDLSLAGTGEGSIGYARRNNGSRGYQSNEKEAEEESRGGTESQGQGRENSFRNVKSRRTNQLAANGIAGDDGTAGNNNARGSKVGAGATSELRRQTPRRSSDEDEIGGNFRQGQLETARESLQPREAVEYAGGNDNYSDYGTHQERRLTTSRHSSGPRGEKIEHRDNLQPNLERSRSADNRMSNAGQDSSSSWDSSGSGDEKFKDWRSFPRDRDLKNDTERVFGEEKNASSYGDSSRPNYVESGISDGPKAGSPGYRSETRRPNPADESDLGTFHRLQTPSELVTSSSRVNQQKSSSATSSRRANNAVSDRGANSSPSSTVSHARSSHSEAFDQPSADIGSQQSLHSEAPREKLREDKDTFAHASSSSSRFHPQKSSRIQRLEKKFDEIDAESRDFNVSATDHREYARRRVSNEGSSDGQRATVAHRSSDAEDDEIPHYDVAKVDDFARRNVGAATNDRGFNFAEYPRPSHPRYPSRSNEEEFFPSSVISQDSKQSEDKGASGIKRFNSTVGSPSSASGPRANVKESSHSAAAEEISRRNNGQSRQRTSEGLQNGLGNGYPSAGRGRELPGSPVIAATIAPGTVYGSSVEKSSAISQARGSSFGTRTPGTITDARSSVTRIGDRDALEKSARDFQNGHHFRRNFTHGRTILYEQPSATSDLPDRESKSERVNRPGRKKSSRLVGKNVDGLNSLPRRSAHEDNDHPMKLRFLPLL